MVSNTQSKPECLALELFHMEMVNYFCDYEIEDNKSREYILIKVCISNLNIFTYLNIIHTNIYIIYIVTMIVYIYIHIFTIRCTFA